MDVRRRLSRFAALGLVLLFVASCAAPPTTVSRSLAPLGNFKLGHNIVVADNAQMVPPSRGATEEEWESVLKTSVSQRFSYYPGDKFYHIAIHVDGYSLAVPGVPVVLAPKSAMVVSVTLWDDAAGGKINEEPEQFTVLETLTGGSIIGTGYTLSKEEQMVNLANNVTAAIEKWMRENMEWFRDGAAPVVAEEEAT